MPSAREIELEALVESMKRQLVAMDEALSGDLALARRYEIALREILKFDWRNRMTDMSENVRSLQDIATMALKAEKSVLPAKRCRSSECVLLRGHTGWHNDGLREWGRRPHQDKRPMRAAWP